jgi:hypothetical protein
VLGGSIYGSDHLEAPEQLCLVEDLERFCSPDALILSMAPFRAIDRLGQSAHCLSPPMQADPFSDVNPNHGKSPNVRGKLAFSETFWP